MRNRGVEIYMLNEIESGNKNVTDIKSLIEQNGLYIEEYQNILLELHDYVSEFVLGKLLHNEIKLFTNKSNFIIFRRKTEHIPHFAVRIFNISTITSWYKPNSIV